MSNGESDPSSSATRSNLTECSYLTWNRNHTMRITAQLLESSSQKSQNSVKYLDLSENHISSIDGLSCCTHLQILILADNGIIEVENLDCCPHLWKVDLSNNKIKGLDGLKRFIALGTLDLSGNLLTWKELQKIRHIQILDLRLHGNPELNNDAHYRIHVVDCMSRAWMVDGNFVTSKERHLVAQFFLDSALSDHPVRNKMSTKQFTPTTQKNLFQTCPYGERTLHLMNQFPLNERLNSDSDHRRIKYLAYNLQIDLIVGMKYTSRISLADKLSNRLVELISVRDKERDKCNIMLLILMAFVEFCLPQQLIIKTLEGINLTTIGNVPTSDLFLLNPVELVNICCLLVGTVKVDKDTKQGGSNLYDELYLTLHYLLLEIMQRGCPQNILMGLVSKWNFCYKWYCNFLALETVLLFAVVPDFYNYIGRNSRVNNMLTLATGDYDIVTKILEILQGRNSQETGVEKALQQASQLIIQKVHRFYHHKIAHSSKYKREHQVSFVLKASKILPHKSVAELLRSCENLHQGIRSFPHKKASINCSDESEMACKIPAVGDYVLTAPQVMGCVVSLPGSSVVEIKIVVAADNSSPPNLQGINTDDRHCIYMDLRQLEWDETHGYWKPQIAIGNKFTSWVPGEEVNDDLKTTYEATEKAHAEPKINKEQKKQSAPLKSGTKPFTARYKQIVLDKKAKAGRKVAMESWTAIMTHEDAELNMLVPAATADLTENPGTSVKQNKQAKKKERQPDCALAYQKKCFEAWQSHAPKIFRNRKAAVKGVNSSRKELPLKNQPTGQSVSTMPMHSCFQGSCNVDSQSSSSYKPCSICAPSDFPQYRLGRKRFTNVYSYSNQNQEQTHVEVQSKNFNAEQTDKVTKTETWASIQIKGKGIMSAVGQRSHSAQIGKSSSLLLQSEEKEIIPLDNDVTNENQEAHSGTQDDCKPEAVSAASADSTENLGTTVKQKKQTCNEGLEWPDSSSSYQSKCMEAWKNISTETSEQTEAVVKSANDSLKKLLLKDQTRKETHKTLSIIPLDGGFAESCTVESKRSLPYKSNPDNAPQNLQKHKIGRKKISTGHSLSEQTDYAR
ncbi:uncharacterized protein LOC119964510 isoform X2 [Scyliorhinus canicula]|nr:uncharacterized protein LOC119964510 isoform X2 [Scyliorhinus canicula]